MKRLIVAGILGLVGLVVMLFILPCMAFAEIRSERPTQIQLVGANLGGGVQLGYNLGDHFLVGADYIVLNTEGEGEETENNETYKINFATSGLYLRYYPFSAAGFYVSAASIFRTWKITVEGNDEIGDSGERADYELTAEWPQGAVRYGLGFNGTASFGLSGGIFLGMISGGEPTLKGKVDSDLISQEDVDKEIDEIEKEEKFGEKYSNVAYIALSIGYNF